MRLESRPKYTPLGQLVESEAFLDKPCQFIQRLEQIEKRFDGCNAQNADPAVIADSDLYRKVTKAHSDVAEVVAMFREGRKREDSLKQARGMLAESDPELRAMAEEEAARLEPNWRASKSRFRVAAAAQGPDDEKNGCSEDSRGHRRR